MAQTYFDLATLLDAGVPILRSFDIMIQGRQGRLQRVLERMRESLSRGSSLAESMEKHRNVFPDLDRMLVEAAEVSGSMGDSFKMLSQWHAFVNKITWRMLSSMAYPLFSFHMAAFIFPAPSLILGKIGFGGYLFRVFTVLGGLYFGVLLILGILSLQRRAPSFRLPFDFFVLRIPILGPAVYHMSVARCARAFAMLYKAGVPITEATERATRATGNAVVAGLFAGAVTSVRNGGMACDGLSQRLPAEYRDLWRIGEETGELDKTSAKVAEIAADRADLFFNEFARWFPIVLWVIIAVIMIVMIFRMANQVYGNLYQF